ncbi:MAG: phosphohydrolase [Patescibacteria group bacterium]
MTQEQQQALQAIARQRISDADPAHDFAHAKRVLKNALEIAQNEPDVDLDVLIPAAWFHDAVNYAKNDPRSAQASDESAELASTILAGIEWYPQEKIEQVKLAIQRCSYSKNLPKDRIEQWIVQDADLLESTGALIIARVFCSSGQMSRSFYDPEDPKAEHRELDMKKWALDLFPGRLFLIKDRVHTDTAKRIALERDAVLHDFYDQFVKEIGA